MAANEVSSQRGKGDGKQHGGQSKQRPQSAGRESMQKQGAMTQIAEEASEYVSRGASQVRELTRDHEGSVVLIGLVAGFGVGLLIGSALAPRRQPRSWKDRMMAEGIGRRMLERIEGMMPDKFAEYFSK